MIEALQKEARMDVYGSEDSKKRTVSWELGLGEDVDMGGWGGDTERGPQNKPQVSGCATKGTLAPSSKRMSGLGQRDCKMRLRPLRQQQYEVE